LVPPSMDAAPRTGEGTFGEREAREPRLPQVVEHPRRRVAVEQVRPVTSGRVHSPVPGEHRDVDALEGEARERPGRGDRPPGIALREAGDGPDPDALEPGVAGDRRVDLGRDDLRPEGAGEGEHDLLPAAEGASTGHISDRAVAKSGAMIASLAVSQVAATPPKPNARVEARWSVARRPSTFLPAQYAASRAAGRTPSS